MATQRYGSFDFASLAALISILSLTTAIRARANLQSPVEALVSTYDSAALVTPLEAQKAIERLTRVLSECHDDGVTRRIKYRIGVLYFKAGMMTEAESAFEQIAGMPENPELIQACCLNMVGQIARLRGDNEKALDAFGRLVSLAEKLLAKSQHDTSALALRRLWRAALAGRAEIYECQGHYAAGAAEYERLLQAGKDGHESEIFQQEVPLIMDRLSQLHLQEGETDKYMELTKALVQRYPAYRRTPMIELEQICVNALRAAHAQPEYSNGATDAPVYLIAHHKHAGMQAPAPEMKDVDVLCRRYQGTPASALLNYHYAWLLDSVGVRDKAIEVIGSTSLKNDTAEADTWRASRSHGRVIREYGVIQQAVMLGEGADYSEALRRLASLSPDPDKEPHISQLVQSVTKSIQILKREAPKYEIR